MGSTLCCKPSPASPDLPVKLPVFTTLHRLPWPAGFTITPERRRLVQFVLPSYYSAGAALFAPGGTVEGVSSWEDLAGQTVALLQGNYVFEAAPQTPALQNVTLLPVADAQGELGSTACRYPTVPMVGGGGRWSHQLARPQPWRCPVPVGIAAGEAHVHLSAAPLVGSLAHGPSICFPTLCRGFRSCAERQGGRLHRVSGWPVCPLARAGWLLWAQSVAVVLHMPTRCSGGYYWPAGLAVQHQPAFTTSASGTTLLAFPPPAVQCAAIRPTFSPRLT